MSSAKGTETSLYLFQLNDLCKLKIKDQENYQQLEIVSTKKKQNVQFNQRTDPRRCFLYNLFHNILLVSDCRYPWRNILNSGEQFTLRYETKYLIEMGQGIDYLMGFAVNAAAQEALKYTVLSGEYFKMCN